MKCGYLRFLMLKKYKVLGDEKRKKKFFYLNCILCLDTLKLKSMLI